MLIQAKDIVLGYRVNLIFCEAIEAKISVPVPWTLVVWSSKSSSAFGYSLSPKQEGAPAAPKGADGECQGHISTI